MSEIDDEIEKTKHQIEINSIPMRMRYKELSPNDGYPNYVTQAEAIASQLYVQAYTEKLRCLQQIKKIYLKDNNENQEQH